jgi:peptide chain release factor 1
MESSYSKRLEELEKRFRELERLLSDTKIISNPEEYKKLSKERAELLSIVETYGLYKKTLSSISSNKELLLEKDSEIQALAKGELSAL